MSHLMLPLAVAGATAGAAVAYGRPALNRRLSPVAASRVLGVGPALAFVSLLWMARGAELPLAWQVTWIPSLDLSVGLYLDGLSLMFALLVTGIGVLVTIYSGQYFARDRSAWRFFLYLHLFLFSMLGLVMAGDVISLFVFWEGTSVLSFLLVAYKTNDAAARRGALRSLLITGGGGIALLLGLLMVAWISGSHLLADILVSGEALRGSSMYLVVLVLVAVGAFTKSAQVPFHGWLPGAMSAPTPASAFLHSATMVKAGIYLLARLNPALGFTDPWFYLLSSVGLLTMLTGAYIGLKQNDLKGLLAYSTISQLGVLVLLIGQDTAIAFKAMAIGVLAHALYKSALFMTAGSIDHEAGTRDMLRLGGLRRHMPMTFVAATIAALSMAGVPPLFGFLAKETLLATASHPDVPALVNVVFPAASVAAGAMLLALAVLYIHGVFLGRARDPAVAAHEAPIGMWLAPLLPALMSLALGLLPEPPPVAALLASAATAAFGSEVKVSLALWTGLSVPLMLSVIAVSLGLILFAARGRVRAWQLTHPGPISIDTVYEAIARGMQRAARAATSLQTGQLHTYVTTILVGTGVLVAVFGRWGIDQVLPPTGLTVTEGATGLEVLRLFMLLTAVLAALATVVLKRGFHAVLALSVSGLSVAIVIALQPAPDVALVQVVVDVLAVVILVLALSRLPRPQRARAWRQDLAHRSGIARDALVSLGGGGLVFLLSLAALSSRPRDSAVTPYYETNAKDLAGSTDVVGAIVVVFRQLDTIVEIVVFAMAGLAVFALLRDALHIAGDVPPSLPHVLAKTMRSSGISGPGMSRRPSSLIRLLASAALPVAMVLAATHIMYGHDQPGDGFTAGVLVGLAIGLWYVALGYAETHKRLAWLKPSLLVGTGILLALANGAATALLGLSPFAYVEYDALVGIPMPPGLHLSSALAMEVAIFLAVLGGVTYVLDGLGHPGDVNPTAEVPSEARPSGKAGGVVASPPQHHGGA